MDDDMEDDARYPPDQYSVHHRHGLLTNHRKPMARSAPSPSPLIPQRYQDHEEDTDSDEDEEEDDVEMEHVGPGQDPEGEDKGGDGEHLQFRSEDSSPDSRRKRRRLDKYTLGFEFTPRVVVPNSSASGSKLPVVRNGLVDWSEDSTFVLLDAWGVLYVKNGRKSLKAEEWSEVAKKVNQVSRTPRSDSQCRNRIDTLKKKYKKEKARMAEVTGYVSPWVHFKKMDGLMEAPLLPPPVARQISRLPRGVDSGEFVFTDSSACLNRPNGLDELMDSPAGFESMGDDSDDDSDGLPPSIKRSKGGLGAASCRMLVDSINKFGEIYERIENSKRQQMVELDRMRREFQRDLEIQRRQLLERAQAELAKIKHERNDNEDNDGIDEHDNNIVHVNGSMDKMR